MSPILDGKVAIVTLVNDHRAELEAVLGVSFDDNIGHIQGDVVSVLLPNCLEFLEAWWAIIKAGGVLGPVNPAFTGPEAGYVIGHSDAVALVTDRRGVDVIAAQRDGCLDCAR